MFNPAQRFRENWGPMPRSKRNRKNSRNKWPYNRSKKQSHSESRTKKRSKQQAVTTIPHRLPQESPAKPNTQTTFKVHDALTRTQGYHREEISCSQGTPSLAVVAKMPSIRPRVAPFRAPRSGEASNHIVNTNV
ncbi:hypothetical protein TWF481_001054 [Arthrobotrys musiformis]|uniref:Uncharacterized protein n=1 Tax=Arthrobotrys musiformis TaxID=47236 RepID=A0AAV9WPD7_9PEZI